MMIRDIALAADVGRMELTHRTDKKSKVVIAFVVSILFHAVILAAVGLSHRAAPPIRPDKPTIKAKLFTPQILAPPKAQQVVPKVTETPTVEPKEKPDKQPVETAQQPGQGPSNSDKASEPVEKQTATTPLAAQPEPDVRSSATEGKILTSKNGQSVLRYAQEYLQSVEQGKIAELSNDHLQQQDAIELSGPSSQTLNGRFADGMTLLNRSGDKATYQVKGPFGTYCVTKRGYEPLSPANAGVHKCDKGGVKEAYDAAMDKWVFDKRATVK